MHILFNCVVIIILELRESEEMFRSIFETSKDVLYITSKDGRFQEINQAAVDLFGFSNSHIQEP
jgi:PAS domain S-box-containing protein